MVKDPYETLGVKRDATADQVRRAFRTLAKRHHPDMNPGNREAEERFKAIGIANELLSDPEKRARFDRGEVDAAGQERPEHAYARAAGGRPGEPDLSEIFGELFRRGGGRPDAMAARGGDQRYQLEVSFADAVSGVVRRLTLPDGRSLEVTIPPGTETGHVLRLRGQGGAGWNGAAAGDALIEIMVAPHRHFRREGDDLHLDLPVTVAEAVLGAKIDVPTPSGPVTMTVPRHSDSGRQLRLRGRGVPAHAGRPAGDLYVRLSLVIGPVDEALEAALRDWSARHEAAPRAAVQL